MAVGGRERLVGFIPFSPIYTEPHANITDRFSRCQSFRKPSFLIFFNFSRTAPKKKKSDNAVNLRNIAEKKGMEAMQNIKEQALILMVKHNFTELRELLKEQNAADLATLFPEFPDELMPAIFRLLPKDLAAQTFVEMENEDRQTLIKSFSDPELRGVLSLMYVDDTVDILEEMPAAIVKRILKNSDDEKRTVINELLRYPDNSAGTLMTVEYIRLRREMTVSEAFERIRQEGLNKETIYTCYVTENDRTLLGVVTAKKMMLADPSSTIGELMETNIIYCQTTDDREDVAHLIEKYDLIAIPVVDAEKRLVGIVTFDDAMDVIKEETDAEFMKMAAVTPMEDNYFKTSAFTHARKRILWLLVLMLSATFTGIIITEYEEALSALLVSFVPMLMDTGGNSGSQSSAMIIRGLATEDIRLRDYGKVVLKELKIGLMVGVTLALANAARLLLLNAVYYHVEGGMTQEIIVVGLTLIGTVLLAKLLGCSLPMLAKRLKLDPALVASPVMTTLVDTATILIYFNIAVHLIKF